MKTVFLIFIGGGLGSITRYGVSQWISKQHSSLFPWGTLVANVAACLTLGLMMGLIGQRFELSASTRVFWGVGFCGGFSTFSTYSAELLTLYQSGNMMLFAGYLTASVALCVGSVAAGMTLARLI